MGIGQRVLDRMRLTDKGALAVIALMILSTFIIPDITLSQRLSVNVGGGIIPIILIIYLINKADSLGEKIRAIIGLIISTIAIFLAGILLPAEPEEILFDVNILYGITGGFIAYILGRSRRCAFVTGSGGIILSDLIQYIINFFTNNPAPLHLGGAGAFDATVISGFTAVIFAELIGELREKLHAKLAENKSFQGKQFIKTLSLKDEENRIDKDEE